MAGNGRKVYEIGEGKAHTIGGYMEEVDGGYNPADFVVPASDHQGHSERIYCRVQPQVERALGVVVDSRKFPFRTKGDVQRWAVTRGLEVLELLGPMPGLIGAIDAINEILKQEMYMQEIKQMFVRMEGVIAQHLAAGAKGEAVKLAHSVLFRVRQIEEEHWRKTCEEDVKRRFGHLLASSTRARLTGGNAGSESEAE